jgi:hypothetical protein
MTAISSIRLLALLICFLLSTAAPRGALAASSRILQGVVGGARFDADSLSFRLSHEESGEDEDLSSMPWVGFIGQHLFAGGSTRFGIEGGVQFGWRSRDTSIVAGSNQAVIRVDSSLWLLDLSAGVCLDRRLGQRWRLYLAAGPAMVFGEYDEDEDVSSGEDTADPGATAAFEGESESEFGIGGYARAGLEYEFAPRALIGFCVRGLATNMEFDNTVDTAARVSGVQAFVTFTRDFGR